MVNDIHTKPQTHANLRLLYCFFFEFEIVQKNRESGSKNPISSMILLTATNINLLNLCCFFTEQNSVSIGWTLMTESFERKDSWGMQSLWYIGTLVSKTRWCTCYQSGVFWPPNIQSWFHRARTLIFRPVKRKIDAAAGTSPKVAVRLTTCGSGTITFPDCKSTTK